jgi:putative flippase GtrA
MFSPKLLKRGGRFLVSGLFITLCDFALFKLLGHWGFSASLARIVSFAFSFGLSFILHQKWTFESTQSWTRSFLPYLQSRLAGFLLAQIVFMLMHDGLGLTDNISFAIQLPIQPIINFLAGYFYVFKEGNSEFSSPNKRWWFEVILAPLLLFIALVIPFHNTRMQGPIWVVPYTSGAANWSPGQPWKVAVGDDVLYKQKTIEQRWVDVATPTSNPEKLITYSTHDEGWMWVLWFTRKAFPFLGDLQGAVFLAILLHLTLSLLILNKLQVGWQRYLFIFIFVCNPLTLHLVTFPYYYYWQAFPSLLAVILWQYREKINVWYLPGLALFLVLCTAVRPNVIFIAIAVLALAFYFIRHWITYVSVVLFAVCFCFIPKTNKMMWHTVYTGLGAYPNNSGLYLSDDCSYAYYKEKTGISIDMSFGQNYYNKELRHDYNESLKNASIDYIKTHPADSLKNVFLNLSIGVLSPYKPGSAAWVYYIQAFLGLIFFGFLIWLRQWPALIGLGLSLGCIAIIYPPIAAYAVGGWVFTAWGLTQMLTQGISRFQKHN